MKTYIVKKLLCGVIIGLFMQGCEKFDYEKNHLFIAGLDNSPVVKFAVEDTPSTYAVAVSSSAKVSEDVNITFELAPAEVDNYNKIHKTNYFPIPESAIEVENWKAVIKAGKSSSSSVYVKLVSTEEFEDGCVYVVPLRIKEGTGGIDILKPAQTIFLRISRPLDFASLDLGQITVVPFEDGVLKGKNNETIALTNYTYEFKVYLTEDRPDRIRRLGQFMGDLPGSGKTNNHSSLMRFGEEGKDRNSLQWMSPEGEVLSKTLFTPNKWYLISCVFDGSRYTMYVDGVKDSEKQGSAKSFEFTGFRMGSGEMSQYVQGRLAEMRIWNRALSASEIKMGLCNVNNESEGLMIYWKFNEGEGTVFHDATGNGWDSDWTSSSSSYKIRWVKDESNKCIQ